MQEDVLNLTATIVSSFVSHNPLQTDQLQALIREVYNTLSAPGGPTPPVVEPPEPMVPIRKSVFPNHIVCLDCGQEMTMLKRHIMTSHGLTVDAYRAKWNLPATYPMTAPEYAETRSELAKKMGLGLSKATKKAKRTK